MTSSDNSPDFQDGKAPDALRTIGEVADALGIRQHVLRYWEEQFPMLRPIKRCGGRRYYRPEDIALIARIDRLVHRDGYTLRGARAAIEERRDEAEAPAAPASAGVTPRVGLTADQAARLRRIRQSLVEAMRG